MIDYTNILTQKIQEVKPSGIRKFFDVAATMKDAISLGVGEPDFVTPWAIREAGIYSLEKGRTYYTANAGLMELREEICNYNKRKYGIEYDPKNEVLVTVGGSEAIDLMVRCIVNPGDEVLIPEPSFVCYKPCTQMAGGTAVPIETFEKDGFRLLPEQLKAHITDKTKLLILPFPNNPTGGVMSKEDLEAIAEVLRGTDIMVLSDEIYGELRYDNEGHTPFSAIEGMRERTVIVNGFSKTFAMTGWRLGYMCAPRELLTYIARIHQYAIMCAGTAAQWAGVEALKNGLPDTEYMREKYNERRQYIYNELRDMGVDCFEPEGAFYIFPDISKYAESSEAFCEDFLQKKFVAVVPGSAFGESGEGHIRISYAASMEKIKEAMKRLREYINEK